MPTTNTIVEDDILSNNGALAVSLGKPAGLLPDDRKFVLRTITGFLLLKKSEVVYFQYNDDLRSWQVYLTENRVYRLRTCITARNILNISVSFFQANQLIIVNVDHLASIDTQLHCTFHPPYNEINITISRRYFQKLKESLEII